MRAGGQGITGSPSTSRAENAVNHSYRLGRWLISTGSAVGSLIGATPTATAAHREECGSQTRHRLELCAPQRTATERGQALSCLSPSRAPAVWKGQQSCWRVVHATEQFLGTIRRVQQKVVRDTFEIVRSFLGPAKLHQRRGWLPERCLFRRAPTCDYRKVDTKTMQAV